MTYTAGTKPTATFMALVTRVWRLAVNRRQVNQLSNLTDAQLEDIGLTRSDLRCARQVSLFNDPSQVLSAWARERSLEKQLPKRQSVTPAFSQRSVEPAPFPQSPASRIAA